MLKITGSVETPRAHLELDPHLPFLLRLGEAGNPGESLIWYCKPDDRTIFEVWLNEKTGVLQRISLVVVAPSRIVESQTTDSGPRVPTARRAPTGDTSPWGDPNITRNFDQHTEADQFNLVLGRDFISISFTGAGDPNEWIVNHRSRFGVDKDRQLCRVDLIGLTSQDITRIRDAVRPYEPNAESQ